MNIHHFLIDSVDSKLKRSDVKKAISLTSKATSPDWQGELIISLLNRSVFLTEIVAFVSSTELTKRRTKLAVFLAKIKKFSEDPFLVAVVFISFTLVFMKKWSPGGNLDTIWYSAVSKNIALSGNYFQFKVSEYWGWKIYDHMPLDYWIVGTLMRLFGISDFVARIYPMCCAFTSYLLVYFTGVKLKDKFFGFACLIAFLICYGSSKWNSSLIHDVPLTMCFLATFYFFIRGFKNPRFLYGVSFFFAMGVFTKGPIIFAFGPALVLWFLWQQDFTILKSKHFYFAALFLIVLLLIPFLPQLAFEGKSYYQAMIQYKAEFINAKNPDWSHRLAYFGVLFFGATPTVLLFLLNLAQLFKSNRSIAPEDAFQMSGLRFATAIAFSVVIPLSIFDMKFPHYMLPVYPFLAFVAGLSFQKLVVRYQATLPVYVKRISIAAICFFVAFPVKLSGGRDKQVINVVDLLKFDSLIQQKDIFYVGNYHSDMSIFQSFNFYGSLNVMGIEDEDVFELDIKNSYLLIPVEKLPMKNRSLGLISEKDCFLKNGEFCVVTDSKNLRFNLPDDDFPYETY